MSERYTGKEFPEGTPVIRTERGERVRSKSEKILADYCSKKDTGLRSERHLSRRTSDPTHFRERAFIHDVLKGCRSMERAFQNWMERDVLFAQKVRKQCGENGYVSIINDGSEPVLSMVKRVTAHFCL